MDGEELRQEHRAWWRMPPREQVLARTRWIAWVVILSTVAACAPPMMIMTRHKLMVAGVLSVVAASLVIGQRIGRVPLAMDLLDVLCFAALVVTVQIPLIGYGIAFQSIIYRGLHTSGRRSLMRTLLYLLTFVVGLPLWARTQPQADPEIFRAAMIAGLMSTASVSFFGWQMTVSITDREASGRRERLISETGRELLGAIDETRIRAVGWRAIRTLVAETPGLRAALVVRTRHGLQVTERAGFNARAPAPLLLKGTMDDDLGSESVREALSAGLLSDCRWQVLTYDELPDEAVALGFPGRVPGEVHSTASSVLNQVLLAYRNAVAHRELRNQALSDPLTGLANRKGFTEATQRILTGPAPGAVSVLFIDLDNFKEVNDNLGHAAGDDLLVRVAAMLQGLVRMDDVVARLGGDEFAVLVRGVDEKAARRIAERVVLGASMLTSGPDGQYAVGASIGLVRAEPGTALPELLIRADLAMYQAKAQGKGRMQVWQPDGVQPAT